MGKGFNNFMCKKFFHPGSIDNLKRVWMAQQKTDAEKKKQEELKSQYDKEQELYNNKALLAKGENKEKLSLNFMYEPPAGMKKEREREDGEPEFKFEWQRKYNGPRESYLSKDDDTIRDQPFGIQVRNVRCIKCKKWGHINTDKECELYTAPWELTNPTTSTDPLELMRGMRDGGLALKAGVVEGTAPIPVHQLVPDDEKADQEETEEMQFIRSLSQKQKLKLLKKLVKLEKKKKRKHKKKKKTKSKRASSESDSSSESDDSESKGKTTKEEKSHKKSIQRKSKTTQEHKKKYRSSVTDDKEHGTGHTKSHVRHNDEMERSAKQSSDDKKVSSRHRKQKDGNEGRERRHHTPESNSSSSSYDSAHNSSSRKRKHGRQNAEQVKKERHSSPGSNSRSSRHAQKDRSVRKAQSRSDESPNNGRSPDRKKRRSDAPSSTRSPERDRGGRRRDDNHKHRRHDHYVKHEKDDKR